MHTLRIGYGCLNAVTQVLLRSAVDEILPTINYLEAFSRVVKHRTCENSSVMVVNY